MKTTATRKPLPGRMFVVNHESTGERSTIITDDRDIPFVMPWPHPRGGPNEYWYIQGIEKVKNRCRSCGSVVEA